MRKCLLTVVLSALLGLGPLAQGQEFSADRQRELHEISELMNHAHSLGEALEHSKADLSDPQYKFLARKISPVKSQKFQITPVGRDGLSIKAGNLQIPVRFNQVNEGILNINNRPVDLGRDADFDIQWDKVMAAMPQAKSHALWQFVLPEANADLGVGEAIIMVGTVALTVWYVVSGDPCDALKSPLNQCTNSVRRFKELKRLHPTWPWKTSDTDKERLAQLQIDGLGLAGKKGKALKSAPCDDNDGDCKMRWHDISMGKCTPPWAAEDAGEAMSAFGESTAQMNAHGMGLRKSVVFDNVVTRTKYANFLRCNAYPDLRECLRDLAKSLHSVCVHPEESVQDYNKSLGITHPPITNDGDSTSH